MAHHRTILIIPPSQDHIPVDVAIAIIQAKLDQHGALQTPELIMADTPLRPGDRLTISIQREFTSSPQPAREPWQIPRMGTH